MRLSIPACIIPVTLCIFLYSQNPEGGKIIPPACPGNIIIEWQEQRKERQKATQKLNK